jgi:hypothetical protein
MAFPFPGLRLFEALFRVCRKDLSVRAIACVARIHLLEGFAQAPGERFVTAPHL